MLELTLSHQTLLPFPKSTAKENDPGGESWKVSFRGGWSEVQGTEVLWAPLGAGKPPVMGSPFVHCIK